MQKKLKGAGRAIPKNISTPPPGHFFGGTALSMLQKNKNIKPTVRNWLTRMPQVLQSALFKPRDSGLQRFSKINTIQFGNKQCLK